MRPEQDAGKLVKALEYLDAEGMDLRLLRALHQGDDETFPDAISYRRQFPDRVYREPNITYHQRLLFVAAEHWRTGRSFDALVAEALDRFIVPAR
ncbi:hypothetical protein PARHAE_02502 [Paracoccus haematequi]|uniref:Uncharacterized protein n=1 Tax=Paracoccus haematequi TaxID=2491866 RepID=A0A3S5D446_9RHOB|nr:hypothetical protein [Paracoccus haematequi]VDS09304.1 hypothetical protein PARHAE_02502 [Paracoccus haematequi]